MRKIITKGTLCALMLLCMVGLARADEKFEVPKQQIIGIEETVPLGELVILSLSKIEKAPPNLASTSVSWTVVDCNEVKKIKELPDGSVVFAAGLVNKKMLVVASVSYTFLVKNTEGLAKEVAVYHRNIYGQLMIGGNVPVPPVPVPPVPVPPVPVPPVPTPDPVFPAGKYNLSELSYKWAMQVNPIVRKQGAAALASSFEGIAAAIAAGTIKDVKLVLTETRKANNDALQQVNISPAHWEGFSGSLQKYLFSLHNDKKLVTLSDYTVAWREITTGLKEIK